MKRHFPELPPYEDGRLTTRQRRALKGPSRRERFDMARSAQNGSGLRIRVSRQVKNQQDFVPELKVWHDSVKKGVAQRKSLGSLAITQFDTNQLPLRFGQEFDEQSLEDLLQRECPQIFQDTEPILVRGIDTVGSKSQPFVALTFGHGRLHREQRDIRDAIAPELALDDSHQLGKQPHVSLGKVFAREMVPGIVDELRTKVPVAVQFAAATIMVEQTHSPARFVRD